MLSFLSLLSLTSLIWTRNKSWSFYLQNFAAMAISLLLCYYPWVHSIFSVLWTSAAGFFLVWLQKAHSPLGS